LAAAIETEHADDQQLKHEGAGERFDDDMVRMLLPDQRHYARHAKRETIAAAHRNAYGGKGQLPIVFDATDELALLHFNDEIIGGMRQWHEATITKETTPRTFGGKYSKVFGRTDDDFVSLWDIVAPVLGPDGMDWYVYKVNALLYGEDAFIMPHDDSHDQFPERATLIVELSPGAAGETLHFTIGGRTVRVPDAEGRQLVTLITTDSMYRHFTHVSTDTGRRAIAFFLCKGVWAAQLQELQENAAPGSHPSPAMTALHDAEMRLQLHGQDRVDLVEGNPDVIAAVMRSRHAQKGRGEGSGAGRPHRAQRCATARATAGVAAHRPAGRRRGHRSPGGPFSGPPP